MQDCQTIETVFYKVRLIIQLSLSTCTILEMLPAIYLKHSFLSVWGIHFSSAFSGSVPYKIVKQLKNSVLQIQIHNITSSANLLQFQNVSRNSFGNIDWIAFPQFWYGESIFINIFRLCSMSFIQKSQKSQNVK